VGLRDKQIAECSRRNRATPQKKASGSASKVVVRDDFGAAAIVTYFPQQDRHFSCGSDEIRTV
jgi:hypothetical protein